MAQHEDAGRVDLFLLRQQLHRRRRVLDAFIHQRGLFVCSHFRAVHIGALVEPIDRHAALRQPFRQIPEGLQAHDRFIPVIGAGTMHQHHRRERPLTLGNQQRARQLAVQRGNGQGQFDAVIRAGLRRFLFFAGVRPDVQPCHRAFLDDQDHIHRLGGEHAGDIESLVSLDFPFIGGADLFHGSQAGEALFQSLHPAGGHRRHLHLDGHHPAAVQVFRVVAQENADPFIRVRRGQNLPRFRVGQCASADARPYHQSSQQNG